MMLSGGALLLNAGSPGTRLTDSGTSASSSILLARVYPPSTEAFLSDSLRSMFSPTAHLGSAATERGAAASRSGSVLGHTGSQTAAPNQAVELTPSARHAGCSARGLATAPV